MRALKACRSYSRRTRGSWESGFQCCRRLLSRAPQGSVLSDNSGRPLQHRQFGDHHWIVAVLCCKHRNGTHAPSGEVDQWVYSRPKEKTVPSSGVLTCMWRKLLTSRVHVKVCPLAHIHHRAAVWASSVGHEAACRHSVAHPLSDVGSHSRRGDKSGSHQRAWPGHDATLCAPTPSLSYTVHASSPAKRLKSANMPKI
jgi:hypothetical protein